MLMVVVVLIVFVLVALSMVVCIALMNCDQYRPRFIKRRHLLLVLAPAKRRAWSHTGAREAQRRNTPPKRRHPRETQRGNAQTRARNNKTQHLNPICTVQYCTVTAPRATETLGQGKYSTVLCCTVLCWKCCTHCLGGAKPTTSSEPRSMHSNTQRCIVVQTRSLAQNCNSHRRPSQNQYCAVQCFGE